MSNLLVNKTFIYDFHKEINRKDFIEDTNIITEYGDKLLEEYNNHEYIELGYFFISKEYAEEFKQKYPNIEMISPEKYNENWFIDNNMIREAIYEITEENHIFDDVWANSTLTERDKNKVIKALNNEISNMSDDQIMHYMWGDNEESCKHRDDLIKKFIRPIMINVSISELKNKIDELKDIKADYIEDGEYLKA